MSVSVCVCVPVPSHAVGVRRSWGIKKSVPGFSSRILVPHGEGGETTAEVKSAAAAQAGAAACCLLHICRRVREQEGKATVPLTPRLSLCSSHHSVATREPRLPTYYASLIFTYIRVSYDTKKRCTFSISILSRHSPNLREHVPSMNGCNLMYIRYHRCAGCVCTFPKHRISPT